MPFARTGLIPDIIINPNCMPKRMTIGQLIEALLSKVCAIKGVYGDATPFTGIDIETLNDSLVESGWEEWGNETMYDGMTGQKMYNQIFLCPTYYQRLKQMVGDKAHCLSTDQCITLKIQIWICWSHPIIGCTFPKWLMANGQIMILNWPKTLLGSAVGTKQMLFGMLMIIKCMNLD